MSGVDRAKDDIKKKMNLMDYDTVTPQYSNTATLIEVIEATQQEVKPLKQQKLKVTVYLTEEHFAMFNELCLDQMKKAGKPEKSQVICDAIEKLHKERIGFSK